MMKKELRQTTIHCGSPSCYQSIRSSPNGQKIPSPCAGCCCNAGWYWTDTNAWSLSYFFDGTGSAIRAFLTSEEGQEAAFTTDHEGKTPFQYLCERSFYDLVFSENKSFEVLKVWWLVVQLLFGYQLVCRSCWLKEAKFLVVQLLFGF